SAMETYFKGMAQIFIQGGWTEGTFLEILQKEKISLADLVAMNKENFTLEELISVTYNFQNLDLINKFYSKMLGCNNFVKEVSEFKEPLLKGKILIRDNPEFQKGIDSLVHYRHLVIHHDTSGRTLGARNLQKMIGSLIDFIIAADFYLMKVSDGYIEK
ncbi:hypothetical protein ACFLYN_03900, partial [Chloroflexota bacterium]